MDMQLSEKQLEEVQQFASFLMAPEEIATILEIDAAAFIACIKSKSGPAYKSFITGKLKTEAELRKTTIAFAKQGSSPAMTAALKLRDEQNIKMERR